MRAAVLMTAFMQDLRILYPPVPVVTGACIALPLPGEASLVMLELEPRVLISFGHYLQNDQGLPVADPEFLVYQAADGQWFPLAITRYLGGKTVYATYAYGTLTVLDPPGQAELADYLDVWAIYLRHLLLVPHLAQVEPSPPEPQTFSPKMQQFVLTLATQYAVDLTYAGAWLRLEAGDTYLLVGYPGEGYIVVSSGYQAEACTPDVQIVFSVSGNGWLPVEILNAPEVWAVYEAWAKTTGQVPIDGATGQMDFANFTEYWADHLASIAWTFADCRPGETFMA